MSGQVFDFHLNDQGTRYDLAAVLTRSGELAFVAATIIGMYAGSKETSDSLALLQSFCKRHSFMRPGHKRLMEHENYGPLDGMSYTIDTVSEKKLQLFTIEGCRYTARHFHEGMMNRKYFIDHKCATDYIGAEAYINTHRAHAFDTVYAISRVLCKRFEADKRRIDVHDGLRQLTAYDLKLPVYEGVAGSAYYAEIARPTYKGIPYNGGSLSWLFRMAAGASVGCDGGSAASAPTEASTSATDASDAELPHAAEADLQPPTEAELPQSNSNGTGFEIAFPTGPIIYLVPFSVSIVVHGLGELFPRPELIVTHNNEVLFDTQPLLAAAIGCSKEEAAAKLRDITKKEQRLYPVAGDLRTQSNEAIVFRF
jgi:hypothetical protein